MSLAVVLGAAGIAVCAIALFILRTTNDRRAGRNVRSNLGCLGTLLCCGLVVAGYFLMKAGGFLVDTSVTASRDGGLHDAAARDLAVPTH